MASSSSKRRRSYDVFLSFRGDVFNNFVDHLYRALVQIGINTYMDREELKKGEQISSTLMEAIQESQIAIVIFSENYASSTWCLDELVKIMECKGQRNLTIFPVFYKVEPQEVRTPRKSYREAMAKHEVKFGMDSEKVTRWKKALFDAGNLSGEHFTDGSEAQLIQHISEVISTRLDRVPLHVAKYQVGIESQVKMLQKILNLQSKDDVLMVGLWGQGGIGKTTLAKAVYNAVFKEFEGVSFLERVRENSNSSNGLVALQEKLLSEILLGKKFTGFSAARGSCLIQDRLHNKRVCIILDDVDDLCQLNALAGDCHWFGNGSRIIITTRDKHLLTCHGVDQDHIYEVETLKNEVALELFGMHAFKGTQEIEISKKFVDKALYYAGGLPLALEVLGCFLCGRGELEWESTLKKLAKSPQKNINGVLKISYYGLEGNEKEIFLDVACFFKGKEIEYIKKVLDGCDFDTTIGIKHLIERSLIREEHGTLQMHDLIQSMGRDIIEEECRDDPRKRSRLWLYEDVLDVLSEESGTDVIKAIVLRLPKKGEIHIGANAFRGMRNLRLLILHNVHNPFTGPIHLPNKLKWFEWPHCASNPEFGDGPKKLVGLNLQNTNIEGVLKKLKGFEKLKFINFSECQSLVCMPNLDYTPNLEELDLSGCNNLEHGHESVAHHTKLQLSNSSCSKNLQRLVLANCSKLRRVPINLNIAKGLRELNLASTAIEELPASIGNLVSLEEMDLTCCKELSMIPSSIYRLRNLEELTLGRCSKLIRFPKMEENSSDTHMKVGFPKLRFLDLGRCNLSEVEFLGNPSCFPSLESLYLAGSCFTKLPPCEHLHNLERLILESCDQLEEIVKIPRQLHCLRADSCKSLSKIPSNMGQVDYIRFASCHEVVRNIPAIYDLFKLERACRGNRFISVTLPGGEMPEWLLPNNDGHISFMASKDIAKKVLGLVMCVVFGVKEGKKHVCIEGISSINNSKYKETSFNSFDIDSDHVWFSCQSANYLWQGDPFGSNDWSCFQYTIQASPDGIVKKCGFRLICEPLENDWEAVLQLNQLLDQDLVYEVRHEESQTSTMEESSSEREESQDGNTITEEYSSRESVHKELNAADFTIEKFRYSLYLNRYRNIHPGGEIPKKFMLVEDGIISFTASQNLYDKFVGLVFCAILDVEDEKKEVSFDIVPYINSQRRNVLSGTLGTFGSNQVWTQYVRSNTLWGLLEGGVDFGEFDEKYLQFSLKLKISGGILNRLGYVIRCWELEDDLKVFFEENPSVNLIQLCEICLEKEDMEIYHRRRHPFGHPPGECSRKCRMRIEELVATYD